MANTFKVVTFAAEPNSAGSPYTVYTTPSSTTTIILGLVLSNIHTSQITTEVELVSTTSGGGRGNNGTGSAVNATSFIVKDAPIPAGGALQVLDGGAKIVMVSGDALKIKSNTASSADVWVSVVDAISE